MTQHKMRRGKNQFQKNILKICEHVFQSLVQMDVAVMVAVYVVIAVVVVALLLMLFLKKIYQIFVISFF